MKESIKVSYSMDIDMGKAVVSTASGINAEVKLLAKSKCANAKSLMGVLSLALKVGDEVTIYASGKEEERAIDIMKELLRS